MNIANSRISTLGTVVVVCTMFSIAVLSCNKNEDRLPYLEAIGILNGERWVAKSVAGYSRNCNEYSLNLNVYSSKGIRIHGLSIRFPTLIESESTVYRYRLSPDGSNCPPKDTAMARGIDLIGGDALGGSYSVFGSKANNQFVIDKVSLSGDYIEGYFSLQLVSEYAPNPKRLRGQNYPDTMNFEKVYFQANVIQD